MVASGGVATGIGLHPWRRHSTPGTGRCILWLRPWPRTISLRRDDARCPGRGSTASRRSPSWPRCRRASPRSPPVSRQPVCKPGPIPRGWSATEILAHLRSCADVWGDCIAAILAEDRPTLRAINPTTWIDRTNYRETDVRAVIGRLHGAACRTPGCLGTANARSVVAHGDRHRGGQAPRTVRPLLRPVARAPRAATLQAVRPPREREGTVAATIARAADHAPPHPAPMGRIAPPTHARARSPSSRRPQSSYCARSVAAWGVPLAAMIVRYAPTSNGTRRNERSMRPRSMSSTAYSAHGSACRIPSG